MDVNLLEFQIMGDQRGALVSIEENQNIPFEIKRVYYIFGTKNNVVRGQHAHKELRQVLVCLNGSCKILVDNGSQKQLFTMYKPNQGLYIGKNVWREMYDFSKDSVLMVLASEYYDENEYIRNYSEFLKQINLNNTDESIV